jgi:hypothetical protein
VDVIVPVRYKTNRAIDIRANVTSCHRATINGFCVNPRRSKGNWASHSIFSPAGNSRVGHFYLSSACSVPHSIVLGDVESETLPTATWKRDELNEKRSGRRQGKKKDIKRVIKTNQEHGDLQVLCDTKVIDNHVPKEGMQRVNLSHVQGLLAPGRVEDFIRNFHWVGQRGSV